MGIEEGALESLRERQAKEQKARWRAEDDQSLLAKVVKWEKIREKRLGKLNPEIVRQMVEDCRAWLERNVVSLDPDQLEDISTDSEFIRDLMKERLRLLPDGMR